MPYRAVSFAVLAAALAAAVTVAIPRGAAAEPNPRSADRSLSPYFVVEGGAPGVETLPLESTRAEVHIAGVISDVTVKQIYRNDGNLPISARYVFPASTRAAVYGLKMTIGQRVIEARIKEREEAKREYAEAKRAGKTASLLEEDRPNVFTMNLCNILPKDHIEVELRYTELLVPTEGSYEMVYPTVVGPRYVGETVDRASPRNQFLASPYTHAGAPPRSAFGIHVSLGAGMPISAIESPSHRIVSQLSQSGTSATVDLDPAETAGGNRDFVLRYRLGGADLASGLLLYPGPTESFFLLMVQPPQRPTLEQIPPREYVFIVDVSGSMHGFPLQTAKALMHDLLGGLRPTDRFDVLLFSGASALYAPQSAPATRAEIDAALAFVDAQDGAGGTELLPALQRAMLLPRPGEDVSRSFVVVTDGYIAEEPAVFDQIRDHLGEANVFSFGIGSSVNRHLMDGIAKAGQGESFVVLDPRESAAAAARFRAYVQAPVLTGVKVAFEGLETYDVEPKVLPDVFAARPVVVFGKYKGAPRGRITLNGGSGRGRFASAFDASRVAPDGKNGSLAYLWARARISDLSDFYNEDAHRPEVVALGLKYNLLTRFTSFIAVEHVVRTTTGSIDVDQPLPMPAGVSDRAIGQSMEVGAEPPLAVLMMLSALVLAGWLARRWRLA